MKHTKKILGTMLLTAAAVVATSCVDDSKLLFSVDKLPLLQTWSISMRMTH